MRRHSPWFLLFYGFVRNVFMLNRWCNRHKLCSWWLQRAATDKKQQRKNGSWSWNLQIWIVVGAIDCGHCLWSRGRSCHVSSALCSRYLFLQNTVILYLIRRISYKNIVNSISLQLGIQYRDLQRPQLQRQSSCNMTMTFFLRSVFVLLLFFNSVHAFSVEEKEIEVITNPHALELKEVTPCRSSL